MGISPPPLYTYLHSGGACLCGPGFPYFPTMGTPPSGACWKSAFLPCENLWESTLQHLAWLAVRTITFGLWDSPIDRDLHWVLVNECTVNFNFLGIER